MVYNAKEIMTLEEAAIFIGVKRSQLYKLTHMNCIPYYKPSGKLVYFEKSELLKWLRQNPVKSQSQIDEEAQTILSRLANK
jgi:excisionase family DNA binding protein